MPDWMTLFEDDQLEGLGELLTVIDGHIDRVERAIERCPDPEAWGYFDSVDSACGLGLAAVQQYLVSEAAFIGVDKKTALKCGPVVASGMTVAAGVNHAANWWKHCDEWQLKPGAKPEVDTSQGVEALGVPTSGETYILVTALAMMVSPKKGRFHELLPLIKLWRDDVRARFAGRVP